MGTEGRGEEREGGGIGWVGDGVEGRGREGRGGEGCIPSTAIYLSHECRWSPFASSLSRDRAISLEADDISHMPIGIYFPIINHATNKHLVPV